MRHLHGRSLLLLLLALLLASLGIVAFTSEAPALGGTCGAATPCECGDNVIDSRTLVNGVDPITTTVCPGDGLVVDGSLLLPPNITLNLEGNTIRGSSASATAGVRVKGYDGLTVRDGRVAEFGTGVEGFVEVNNTRLANIHIVDNTVLGILVDGDRSIVEDCVVSRNGGSGILLFGTGNEVSNENQVRRCRIEDNEGDGIEVRFNRNVVESTIVRRNAGTGIVVGGDGNRVSLNRIESNGAQGISVSSGVFPDFFGLNTIARNIVSRHAGDGVEISGDGALIELNQSKYNQGEGFRIEGSSHTVRRNVAISNDDDGFTVSCLGCRFDRNRADYNGGFGIDDDTTGGGTGGTANTYVNNVCTGNALGHSSPPGLCS